MDSLFFPGGCRWRLDPTSHPKGYRVFADAIFVSGCDRIVRLNVGDELPECPHEKSCQYRRIH